MDKLIHKNYTEDMSYYPEKPYELKHIYNIPTDKYVVNELQCCFYSPISCHKFCNHKKNCILNDDKWEYYNKELQPIVQQIKDIRILIKELEEISQASLNNEIIYHPFLEEYYIIEKEKVFEEGRCSIKINVDTVPNFRNVIKLKINNLKIELRNLNRELLRLKRKK